MKITRYLLSIFLSLVFTASVKASTGKLMAGAAKIDITPTEVKGFHNVWQAEFEDVHDPLYARCLVVDNGIEKAALISVDIISAPSGLAFRDKVAEKTGIPKQNIIINGTHTHNAPVDFYFGSKDPKVTSWMEKVENAIIEVVEQAQSNMQAAKIGVGVGRSHININRDEYTPYGWLLGNNPDGPSDKSVRVLSIHTLEDKPIAVFVNYDVHAVVLGAKNVHLTADLPGATSNYIEEEIGGGVVALWTSGAAGDQNPIFMGFDTTYGKELNKDGFKICEALGVMLGEEVLRTRNNITSYSSEIKIKGIKKTISCPVKELAKDGAKKADEASPVENIDIQLDLLLIDQVAITGVSGEVETLIYKHLKDESPLKNTFMITHTSASIGYIPADKSYDRITHQVRSTKLERGHAENAIVEGLLAMIGEALRY